MQIETNFNEIINIPIIAGFEYYYKYLDDKKKSHIEDDKQVYRHLSEFLLWSVFDSRVLKQGSPAPILPRPKIDFAAVKIHLKDYSQKLSPAIPILELLTKDKIIGVDSMLDWVPNILSANTDFKIDTHTAVSALISVLHYDPKACCRNGNQASETQVKIELWAPILSSSFQLGENHFQPIWEFYHLLPGNCMEGSSRSDFASVVTNQNHVQFPFFIVEFEKGSSENHKDFAVIVCEATFELNRILTNRQNGLDKEILQIALHTALIQDTRISFGTFRPIFNDEKTAIVYKYHRNVKSFDIGTTNTATNIQNVLEMIVYLRKVVCEDGLVVKKFIQSNDNQNSTVSQRFALPKLPNKALVSRTSKTKYTPKHARKIFNFTGKRHQKVMMRSSSN